MDELGVIGKSVGGRYNLTRFIGAGTMGAVYEATQDAVDRRVAVKLLNASLQTRKEVQERFRVEAQAVAALNHPNSVTLFDFGFSDEINAHYMAMEYLDGATLDVLIAAHEVNPTLAMTLVKQVADVLVVAHAAKIVHRDLKPENIMVLAAANGEHHAKVLDFGLARIFEASKETTRLTHHGQLFGTPAYMSPEQCHSVMDVGPPTDVYALGVTLYESLTGELPFAYDTVPELLVAQMSEIAPLVPVSEAVPYEVSELVERMLAKHPDDRPTAEQVSQVLTAVLQGVAVPELQTSAKGNKLPAIGRRTLDQISVDETQAAPPTYSAPTSSPATAFAIGGVVLAALLTAVIFLATPRATADDIEMTAVISAPTVAEPVEVATPTTTPADLDPYLQELVTSRATLTASSVQTQAARVVSLLQREPEHLAATVKATPVAKRASVEQPASEPTRRDSTPKQPTPKLRTLGGAKDLYQ